MKTVAVVGRKDGIGKTTIAVHLAGELAMRGHETPLVDANPQGRAAQWASPGKLPLPVEHLPVTADALAPWVKRVRAIKADVLPRGPSGLDMMAIGEVLAGVPFGSPGATNMMQLAYV